MIFPEDINRTGAVAVFAGAHQHDTNRPFANGITGLLGVCFQDIQRVQVRELEDPILEQPTDAIVTVEMAGLCGSDLHPFFGREVGIEPGTVMGHEFVGTVTEVGSELRNFKEGDRVCAPFTTNCGECFFCERGVTSRCELGQLFGWRENQQGLHGGQAQQVRVPLADSTLMHVPNGMNAETAILLGDNLSTGFFAAEQCDIRSDGVYVVIGCGNVGLLAILAAKRRGAETVFAVDPNPARLIMAKRLGAMGFLTPDALVETVKHQTNGRGADGVMELVGLPEAQALAYQAVRPGGTLSVIGCHCSPHFAFSPTDAYDKNLTYRTGRCPARHYMDRLSKELMEQPMDLGWCTTHRFSFADAERAYDVFANRKDGCIKAVFVPE